MSEISRNFNSFTTKNHVQNNCNSYAITNPKLSHICILLHIYNNSVLTFKRPSLLLAFIYFKITTLQCSPHVHRLDKKIIINYWMSQQSISHFNHQNSRLIKFWCHNNFGRKSVPMIQFSHDQHNTITFKRGTVPLVWEGTVPLVWQGTLTD